VVTPVFQNATAADLDVIRAMLSANDLPAEDIHEHVGELILAKCGGETIGTVAIETAGHAALLRSLCVAPRHRGQNVGARLLTAVEAKAASRGVREVYLLTTSAAAFFERHGFSRISRADAPKGIRSTAQFLSLCPSTAVCMRKTLPTFSNERTRSP
jgi:amino-acid N-acetyltransferase